MPEPTNFRRDIRRTFLGAWLGAVGTGLISTFLVGYLAQDLGAGGLAVAWLIAAPRFAGVQRLGAPALLAEAAKRGFSRKRLCLVAYAVSAVTLAAAPLVTWGASEDAAANAWRITLLVVAWLAHKGTRQLADIFYWSWVGDLYPARLRSRLVGLRERWWTFGRVVGIGASVSLAAVWSWATGDARTPLAVSAWAGVLMMLAALAPLGLVSPLLAKPSATPASPWRTLRAALSEKPYRRLLAYEAWLALASGLTGAANYTYPVKALGIGYPLVQSAAAGMWLGQSALAGGAGRLINRLGSRAVMIPAQVLVAFGPLAYLLVTPDAPWLIAVPYALWVAYAGINVGLNTLQIGLADPDNNAPYLAVFQAIGGLLNGVTFLAGGWLHDRLTDGGGDPEGFATLFAVGTVARLLAVWPLSRLIEPTGGSRAKLEGCPAAASC